ncbi:hypothetical protein BpHYR1_010159 [Brachionus plicatilis]|uniref:Uncharacterized protein n=1 Tax=Brachionus plicatilis TaxID=10195 RepID=A0A3M7PWP2_BRAPC|nr:hypothetical protein BpHYR1_010159 [Brachionus plicatilis]
MFMPNITLCNWRVQTTCINSSFTVWLSVTSTTMFIVKINSSIISSQINSRIIPLINQKLLDKNINHPKTREKKAVNPQKFHYYTNNFWPPDSS